jgi:hypothetical protein
MDESISIFIGSSSEALNEADLVEKVIRDAGMNPVVWNRDVFVLGKTLLEAIEGLPFNYHAAVLLVTPDVSCSRKGRSFFAPVANVVFEYGYLAARLTRERVAICKFGEADLPSDLGGMKLVEVKHYMKDTQSVLPEEARVELSSWLKQMPRLAAGISPISQVHGYSGTWSVQNKFSKWHGITLGPNDKVTFDGKALLTLRNDGEQGSGTQIGQLKIKIGRYEAKWDIANEIIDAKVDKKGSLTMLVKNCIRTLVKGTEKGVRPSDTVREALPSPEWELKLEPLTGEPLMLTGKHSYPVALEVYSEADEVYRYIAL